MLRSAHDRTSSLANGGLVEASVRARVLGIPLLRLEATIVLAPVAVPGTPRPFSPGRPRRSAAAGDDLAEAVRRIKEGAEVLAEVRRNGTERA